MIIEDCQSAINFSGISLFSYRLIKSEYRLNCFLPTPEFWPEIKIENNSISAWINDFWDIEFKTNWVKFRRGKGDCFLSVDFRKENIEIEGNIELLGKSLQFGANKTSFGSFTGSNIIAQNSVVGLSLGPPGRLLPPNYAMVKPKLQHLKD